MAEDEKTPRGGFFDRVAQRAEEGSKAAKGRSKLDADSIAAQRNSRREEKAKLLEDQVGPSKSRKVVTMVAAGAMIVGVLALASGYSNAQSSFDSEFASNARHIGVLQAEVDSLTKTLALNKDTGELSANIAADAALAREYGDRVAGIQNDINAKLYAGSKEPTTSNGAPSKGALAAIELRRGIGELYAPDSLILDESVAYGTGSSTGLTDGQGDPRLPWFTKMVPGDNGFDVASADTYRWAVESVMPIDDDARSFIVMWSAYDDDGSLLAWAESTYSADEKRFVNFSLITTLVGSKFLGGGGA